MKYTDQEIERYQEIIYSPDFDEMIETLSVVELEGLILHLDNSLDGEERQEEDCIRERCYRLHEQMCITDVEYDHIKRVNTILLKQLQQVIDEAKRLCEHLRSIKLQNFDSFEINIAIFPKYTEQPSIKLADDGSGSDYLAMAKIFALAASKVPSLFGFEMSMCYDYNNDKDTIRYSTDFDDNNELWDWYDETFHDHEMSKRDRFFTCHAMHSLLTHNTYYSYQDVIRIEEFESRINVEYQTY